MKKIYWRPSKVPRIILVVLAVLSVGGMLSVELFKVKIKQPYYAEKIRAARLMKDGMEVLKKYRIKTVGPIESEEDPANSGLIGSHESPITSKFGYLPAKQTTVNPNWAAVIVGLLKKAGAREGDTVAMGFSGSFPTLNLAALAAAEALELKVIAITSVAASTHGANIPNFTWLDMERILYRKRLVSHKSVAASLGGQEDRALARSKKGRELLREAINRNDVEILEAESFNENIGLRMEIYQKSAEGKRIAAYVNVGGGIVSVGTVVGKKLFKPGLNRRYSPAALSVDSVMSRFARDGVPIIHLVRVNDLAERYGLPKSPRVMPAVGEGHIFTRLEYNIYLVAGCLVMLLLISYIFLRLDIGYRIFSPSRITKTPGHPEPMV